MRYGTYTVVLRYADGGERATHVNATGKADAKRAVLAFAKRQLADPFWGGDRSKGMPRIVEVRED